MQYIWKKKYIEMVTI